MPSITYRLATALDGPDLFRWKNDAVTRRFAIKTHAEITPQQHLEWMLWMLDNKSVRVYIIECNGTPCGDVRFEIHAHWIEIAVKIDPDFRGNGIASEAIRVLGDSVQAEQQKPLVAKIVYGNVASMRLFESAGYKCIGQGEGYYLCSKDFIQTSK